MNFLLSFKLMSKNNDWKVDKLLQKDINTFIAYSDFSNYRTIKNLIQEKYNKTLVHFKKIIKHSEDYTQVLTVTRFTFQDRSTWVTVYSFLNDKKGKPIDNIAYFFDDK